MGKNKKGRPEEFLAVHMVFTSAPSFGITSVPFFLNMWIFASFYIPCIANLQSLVCSLSTR